MAGQKTTTANQAATAAALVARVAPDEPQAGVEVQADLDFAGFDPLDAAHYLKKENEGVLPDWYAQGEYSVRWLNSDPRVILSASTPDGNRSFRRFGEVIPFWPAGRSGTPRRNVHASSNLRSNARMRPCAGLRTMPNRLRRMVTSRLSAGARAPETVCN